MRQLIPVFLWCSVALFATSMCGCQRHLSATKMAAHAEAQAEDSLFWGVTLAPPIIEEGVINHLLATSGAITPQKDETLSFVVPRMDGISALLVGDSLEWSFRSPSGRIILPGITPNSADYEYDGANGMAGFMLRDPTVGVWTATVRSLKPDSAAAYGVDLQVEGSTPEWAHLETMVRGARPDAELVVKAGDTVFVRTFVANGGKPIPRAQCSLRARMPSDRAMVITMYDDGRHADGAAADGVWVGAFRAESAAGFYKLRADCRTPTGTALVVVGQVEVRD